MDARSLCGDGWGDGMKLSSERVLTTHVGSLPRPPDVSAMLLAREDGTLADERAFDACMTGAVAEVVQRQVDAGVDIVSDGEMSKIGYSTYIKDRLAGFSGDSPRRVPADLALYPDYVQRIAAQGQTPRIKRAMCTGEIAIKDERPLATDLANMQAAMAGRRRRRGRGVPERRLPRRDLGVPAEPALCERGRLSGGARRRHARGIRGDPRGRLRDPARLPRPRHGPAHHVRGRERGGLPRPCRTPKWRR